MNDLESATDFSDDHSLKELDLIASGSFNKEIIEGLKEPGFKTPISPAASPTAPRKTKGIIKNVYMFCQWIYITYYCFYVTGKKASL